MPKQSIAVLALVAGCADPAAKDLFVDEGQPSTSAAELLGKHDSITNDSIAGVYERKGQGSGLYPVGDQTYQVINDWVLRVELRENSFNTAFQCNLSYREPGRAAKTLVAFTQQTAVTTDSIYDVTAAANKTEHDPLSMSDCTIGQAAEAFPFCEERTADTGIYVQLPMGANTCIGRRGQELYVVRGSYDPDSNFGTKVAN